MILVSQGLQALAKALGDRIELDYKRDIQLPAGILGREARSEWFPSQRPIENGDDAAVLEGLGEAVLFAAEGIRGELVASDPWFAGFCGVLTNVNDIAAMGGRPWAVVDVLFLGQGDNRRVLQGMAAAAALYGVPVVGGHTTRTEGASMLAVAVVGRARRLTESSGARPGEILLAAVCLKGGFRGAGGAFDAVTSASPLQVRAQLAALAELAEAGLVSACKDISMAGLCGTLSMMLESSRCGARIDLDAIPAPDGVDALRWLTAFPSFGFLLSVKPGDVGAVCARFDALGVTSRAIGTVDESSRLEVFSGSEVAQLSDWRETVLTGFGP